MCFATVFFVSSCVAILANKLTVSINSLINDDHIQYRIPAAIKGTFATVMYNVNIHNLSAVNLGNIREDRRLKWVLSFKSLG